MQKSRLSKTKKDKLIEHFVAGTTARCASDLIGVNRKTSAYYLAQEADEFLSGEIIDGSVIETKQNHPGKGRVGKNTQDSEAAYNVKNSSYGKRKTTYGYSADNVHDSKQYVVWDCVTKGKSNLEAYMDFDLVTIIVSNAIDNAIKYTPKGYVNTTFEIIEGYLEIIVHDSGVGLTKDEINILENSPNQLQNSINRKKDGWGIGLATMYRFADFLDGHVYFDSSKGFGTKVTITIPVMTREAEMVKTVKDESAVSHLVSPKISNDAYSSTYVLNVKKEGFKVFVVDNSQSHLDQMEELLSPHFLRRKDVEVTFCTTSSDIRGIISSASIKAVS